MNQIGDTMPMLTMCQRCRNHFNVKEMVQVRRKNVWLIVCLECGQQILKEEHEWSNTREK